MCARRVRQVFTGKMFGSVGAGQPNRIAHEYESRCRTGANASPSPSHQLLVIGEPQIIGSVYADIISCTV